jgi:hypothetical protein
LEKFNHSGGAQGSAFVMLDFFSLAMKDSNVPGAPSLSRFVREGGDFDLRKIRSLYNARQ